MLHIFAAALALSDPTGPAVEARIADVIADPERYGGQTLRIRGQVDACYGYVCSICPEQMTPETADDEKCLRMSFDDLEPDRYEAAQNVGYWQSAGRLLEEGYRFSVITAEGRFDPGCLPRPALASNTDLEEVIVCTDRATTFRDARIAQVHRRLVSNEGLDFSRHGRVTRAPAEVSAPVEEAFRALERAFDPEPEWKEVAVFQPEQADFPEHGKEAWACVCRIDDCGDRWPRRHISVQARTLNDPYSCHIALQLDGVWRVFPE